MDKRQSQWKENMGMQLFISGHSFAALVATIICGMLAFYFLKKRKKSVEKESTSGASAPSFICSTPTGGGNDQYGVFLSFRGSDTRKKFTDHLYHSLVKAGTVPIFVFKDGESIPIGEEFASQIFGAITRSKISIPIISENYAMSKWCLRELVHMMDRRKSTSHIVLPIFYGVESSDVRYLKGKFGKAYRSCTKHFDKDDIPKFEQALNDVSYLQVWESGKVANGHEGELVQKVVDTVLSELRHDFQLDVTKYLVGMDDHINKIRNWAASSATHARMIGIYGMGGIGKTTLAKAIYNELSKDFVDRSYLSDIRDKAGHNGIPYVQNQLIKDILPNEREVSEVDHGINLIKSRFKFKKVLIILDDIDDGKQLHALARERDWFMAGSIIIVTTRYEAVLDQSEFEVDYKYLMNKLDEVQSVLLFNKHAFRMNCSSGNFEDISRRIISILDGLPLALEVVGSYLFRKTDPTVWKDMLQQLQKQPHKDVQTILKISYDALTNGQKEIFLDIACFFVGKKSKFAMYMWDDCGFYASQGIEELKLRCLIKIGDYGELMMHDQLRDLGRSIVGQGQPPERRSRLWLYEEASTMLMEKKGTKEIKAICLAKTYRSWIDELWYTNEHFKNLPSLRFLQLKKAALSGNFNKLFSELRWLQWFGIKPNQSFTATNLHLSKLVVLQLSHNPLTNDWGGWSSMMAAKKLKVLDLESCYELRRTPDFSALKDLEIIILKGCYGLEQVHPSIGKVKSLVSLDLSYCGSLKALPEELGELKELKELILDNSSITQIPTSIGSLRKLENLNARNCRSLREIPSSIGCLSSLKDLNLNRCEALKEIPSSIGNLCSLQHLYLSECRALSEIPRSIGNLSFLQDLVLHMCTALREIPSSIGDLQNLQHLNMNYSKIEKVPGDIGRLKKLRELWLIGTRISNLPDSIQNLSFLQELAISECGKLHSLPALPSTLTFLGFTCQSRTLPPLSHLRNLQELCLYRCLQLESIPKLPLRLLKLDVDSCSNVTLPELDGLEYLEELEIGYCPNVSSLDLSRNNRLKRLKAEGCCFLVEIKGLDNLQSLEEIVVDHCETIPRLILPELKGLKLLCAPRCDKLVEIRGLDKAKCLEVLDITGCISIESLPDLSGCEKLQFLRIQDCKKLTQLRGLEKLNLSELDISGCDAWETIPHLPRTRVSRNPT